MHDIWNPWHGCVKCSEGCQNCYMYFLDKMRQQDGSHIYLTKRGMEYPLSRDRQGRYKVKSGELIRVCMTSDFFLAEADPWREEAWDVMRQRPDVRFFLLTKRPQRMADCLPEDWGDGWENVMINVSAENQRRADERIPILLKTPAKHRGVMCAPLIGPVNIEKYLPGLEQIICGGENYDGARPCDFAWVQSLRAQCQAQNVSFCFIETGTVFVKDGKRYRMPDKRLQSQMAYKSGMSCAGKPIQWRLRDNFGQPIPASELYEPYYGPQCQQCGSRPICNGCARCGKCEGGN